MAHLNWITRYASALGMAIFLIGCGPRSYVHIKAWDNTDKITYVDYSRVIGAETFRAAGDNSVDYAGVKGAEIFWAVGDNSDAYRPALCAPNPGPYRYGCLGVYVSGATSKAVYVEHLVDTRRYEVDDLRHDKAIYCVYDVQNVKVELSDRMIKGEGVADILFVDRDGKPLEPPSSPVPPRKTTLLTFELHRSNEGHDRRLYVILDDLRPLAEEVLFKSSK
ncbi:MAG: hypothetical protein ABSH10_03530 [Phycisphaerae bacterium]|jgi:hypothetical protein